nr:adenosylhomocysteinase [Lachnospiraceae bacterium]
MSYEIKDIALAESGEHKIDWVRKNCPLLRSLEEDFTKDKPFKGIRVALSIHLEAKTAYLCKVLAAGGAEMYITGSNPLSTQDDVAAALAKAGLNVFAKYDCNETEYFSYIETVLKNHCNIMIDDGGDLVNMLHTKLTDEL